MDAHPAGRAGEPAGPDRGRRDCRARLPLPRHPGHLDLSDLRGRDRPDRRQREGLDAARETRISRRSTSTRIRTRGTIRAPRCSRSRSCSGNPTGGCSARRCWARTALPSGSIPLPWRSRCGCTIYDLEESELSYAPPFGSAKDPVNFAGMVAANILRGDMPLTPLGLGRRRVPPRCAQSSGTCRRVRSGRGQYPVAATSLAPR